MEDYGKTPAKKIQNAGTVGVHSFQAGICISIWQFKRQLALKVYVVLRSGPRPLKTYKMHVAEHCNRPLPSAKIKFSLQPCCETAPHAHLRV